MTQIEPEQVATLHELEVRLRDALATEDSPRALSRFYHLLEEVRQRIAEAERNR
jgi:hypothetical protein